MRTTLNLLLAMAALAGPLLAAGDETPARRIDTETYETRPDTTPGSQQATATIATSGERSVQLQVPAALAELRTRHAAELAGLASRIQAARSDAAAGLEREAELLKQRQRREELTWLRDDAASRGDLVQLRLLEDALTHIVAAPEAAGTMSVPRDPLTGRALGAEEGAAR